MSKKDFQKTIKAIRQELGYDEYPKAMCTARQMEKGTATVNCGGEWMSKQSAVLSEQVMKHPKFIDFLQSHNATASFENGSYDGKVWTQIRLHYNAE